MIKCMDMQPNNQHPIDYLDSIATVPKGGKKPVSDKLFFGVLAGGLLIALLVGAFALFNTGTNTSDDFASIGAKLQSLQSLADASQKNIVSSNLRGTNSNLSLALANSNRDITEPLAEFGIDSKKIETLTAGDKDVSEILERLEDARLNAVFDRTYAREMSYQLETLLALIDQTKRKTDSTANQEFLSTTRESIAPLQEQFAKFSAATS